MKRNAIARVVIYSVIVVMLAGILIAGLGRNTFSFDFDFENEAYTTGSGSVPIDSIHNIRVEWVSGKIDLIAADVSEVSFSETGYGNQEMIYKVQDDTLVIISQKPTVSFGTALSSSRKDLKILVPKYWNCDNLIVEVASAKITGQDLLIKNVEIDTASGECKFLNCNFDNLDANTASGEIYYEGALNTLQCDAASADFIGIFQNVPDRLEMDSMSGDMDITIPADYSGFRASVEALSGKFTSDYAAQFYNGRYNYGDGHCIIEFEGMSGNITVRKPK